MAFLVLLLSSCKPSEPITKVVVEVDQNDPVAITVGEREVRLSELQADVDFLHQKRIPSAASREAFLESCVERLVALEKARELELDQDIELRRQWENLLIGRLKKTALDTKLVDLTATDDEIKAYYERNKASYSKPAQVHLALLFLGAPKHSDEDARQAIRQRMDEARALATELADGARGFGAHAMTYSEEATSRFKGGDIGWMQAGEAKYRWPAVVVETGFALAEKGDLSDVIATDEGFYLLKKLDSREAVVRSLDGRLRSSLENALLKEKRMAIQSGLQDGWKASFPVTANDEVLSNLKFHSETGIPASPQSFPSAP